MNTFIMTYKTFSSFILNHVSGAEKFSKLFLQLRKVSLQSNKHEREKVLTVQIDFDFV